METIKSNTPEYFKRRRELIKAGLPTHHKWKAPKAVREFNRIYMQSYRARKRAEASNQ